MRHLSVVNDLREVRSGISGAIGHAAAGACREMDRNASEGTPVVDGVCHRKEVMAK
jgi:hypothetical protein